MINYRILLFIGCLSLLMAIAPYYTNTITQPIASHNAELVIEQQLLKTAREIAVKIRVNQTFGSGIIIQKNNNVYTVVTNRHVVARGDKYHIQTPDEQIYTATLVTVSSENDLAILEFTSDRNYATATINTTPLQLCDSLFAAGFPFHSERLQVTSGKLSLQTIEPLKQGYQLGYSNTIYKGMSGGAILNSLGEVVGINGRSANPIIPEYQYQDQTYPSPELQQQMIHLSWGIPIAKAIELLSNY